MSDPVTPEGAGTDDVGAPSDCAPTPIRRTPVAVLIGFMGAGKSTVGRILADRFGVDFVDADAEIVRVAGRTIPQIFEADGEAGFRGIESDVVTDLVAHHGGVIALGGGAVMTPVVADALAGRRVIYLRIDPDAGFDRVSSTDRPLIAGDADDEPARRARYRDLLATRDSTYSALATVEVDAGLGEPDAVADVVVTAIADQLVPERTS